eukprot:1978986-Rhodomonas_salina.3
MKGSDTGARLGRQYWRVRRRIRKWVPGTWSRSSEAPAWHVGSVGHVPLSDGPQTVGEVQCFWHKFSASGTSSVQSSVHFTQSQRQTTRQAPYTPQTDTDTDKETHLHAHLPRAFLLVPEPLLPVPARLGQYRAPHSTRVARHGSWYHGALLRHDPTGPPSHSL